MFSANFLKKLAATLLFMGACTSNQENQNIHNIFHNMSLIYVSGQSGQSKSRDTIFRLLSVTTQYLWMYRKKCPRVKSDKISLNPTHRL